MATLENKSPSEFYKDLLHTANSNSGADTNSTQVQAGNGNSTALNVGRNKLIVKPSANTTNSFDVQDASGTSIFKVDTTNGKAMTGTVPINTQVKEFNLSSANAFPTGADTWTALPANALVGESLSEKTFGSSGSSAPATTSLTITSGAQTYVPYIWYVPYNIELFAVKAQTTSDGATGDNFIYSISKYDLNTGGTSSSGDLTNGVEIARSAVVTNAGWEQIYYNDLVLASATVSAGQAVLAFVSQAGTNSDLACNLQVFYRFV